MRSLPHTPHAGIESWAWIHLHGVIVMNLMNDVSYQTSLVHSSMSESNRALLEASTLRKGL